MSEEDRAKLWQEVWSCRRALAVEHKMLQEPPQSGNFLTTTLRRYNRARLQRLQKAREEKDFEKIFKQSFWSYTKSMLKQPLTVLEGEKGNEVEDVALRLFFTIQQHAGEQGDSTTLLHLSVGEHLAYTQLTPYKGNTFWPQVSHPLVGLVLKRWTQTTVSPWSSWPYRSVSRRKLSAMSSTSNSLNRPPTSQVH